MAFWDRLKSSHEQIHDEPHPKRISTPAGNRLSVILENGGTDSHAAKTRESHRTSVRKSGLSPALADAPRESMEDGSGNSSGYSYSVWSDGEKRFAALRNHKQIAKRGGWRKLAILLLILLAIITALAVGLAVGLRKKSSGDSPTSSDTQSASPLTSSSPTSPSSPSSPSSSSSSSSSLPANFPLGTFSLVTFLDNVQTNCTANPSTWTCYPYTDYYTDKSRSSATFNWVVSGSKGAYKISSTSNPLAISFKNADLELLDEGTDEERYKFQLQQMKTVSPTMSLTDDGAAVQCDYSDTTLQAQLFTRKEKSYPDDTTMGAGTPSYTTWPFAVLIEQSTAGGQNVPSCHKTANGQQGAQIDGLEAQDGMTLCSCLYKNWHTR